MIQNSRTFNWNPIGTYCIMSTQRQAVLCSNPIFEIRGGQNLKKAHGQGRGRVRFCGERFECPSHVVAGSYEEPVGLFQPDAESGDDIFSIHCYRV